MFWVHFLFFFFFFFPIIPYIVFSVDGFFSLLLDFCVLLLNRLNLKVLFFFFQIRYEVYFTLPFLTGANIFSSCNFCVSSNLLAFNLYGVLKTRQPLSNQPCEQAVSLKFYKRM